jgi:LPXTG-site transpeptidase (sortase) family protein
MASRSENPSTLRRINNALSIIVVCLSLYIALSPLWPGMSFWWRTHFGRKPALVVANTPVPTDKPKPPEVIPEENTLVIPKLAMQEIIYDGATVAALRKGVWHRPHTSSPDQGSNTVLVGHRFTYNGPAVFYNLDKVGPGDQVIIYWQKEKYVYEIKDIKVVLPTAIEIEAPTDEPQLTIYTCTPLLTAKNRLIIRAVPLEKPL